MTIINYIINNITNKKIKNIDNIPNLTNSMLTIQKKSLIDNLNKKYIFQKNTIDNKTTEIDFKYDKKKTIEETVKDNYFIPKQKDSLFWCIYIFKYGMKKFKEIENYGNTELNEKQKCIKYIESNPNILKTTKYKITNINIQEIKSDLMTVQTSTSYNVLIAFIFFYNINIYILHENNKMFLSFKNDTNEINHIIMKNNNKFSIVKMNLNNEEIEKYVKHMYCLVHFEKPIKGLSTYKVSDLHEIAKILNINNYDSYKKNQLYELIQLQLIWDEQVR
tara:strand:+ start:1057 stop:1887 length:831 start_codon:yes stop_codon:yes gene_type:complete